MTKQAKETIETIGAIALWLSAPAMMVWVIFNGYPSDLATGIIIGLAVAAAVKITAEMIKAEKENHNG